MILYHATPYRNLPRIIAGGLETRFEEIYFADSAKAAAGFVLLRGEYKIAVIELEFEDKEVRESFDHNETIFKKLFQLDGVKCYIYNKNISARRIDFDKVQIIERV